MGGKRPEQIHKDKLSTDYKTRTDDQQIHAEDKARLHEERGKLAERDRARAERMDDQADGQPADERDVLESD